MKIIIFDDKKNNQFFPLTLNRSTSDLRVGILKLRQRINAYFEQDENLLIIDNKLKKIYSERHPEWNINKFTAGEYLFINSRIKMNDSNFDLIKPLKNNEAFIKNDSLIAFKAKINNNNISYDDLITLTKNFCKIETDLPTWERNWDFIHENSDIITQDFHDFFYDKDNYFETEMGVTILNPYSVWLGENVILRPGVILDASDGPIIVDEEAEIMHNAVVIGPAYIGKNSKIKVSAKIYEGTTIGPVCKVGGELEESIIHGYSNKQHDGFLGHSYLGEWVNLGADTNNSDLKNNYKNVTLYSYDKKSNIDSNSMFVGCMIGDHAKTGINVSINTGTTIGLGANLYGRDLVTGFVPDFSWGTGETLTKYRLEAFLETTEKVKLRRKLALTSNEKELYTILSETDFDASLTAEK